MKTLTITAKLALNEISAKEWAKELRSYGMEVELKEQKTKKKRQR